MLFGISVDSIFGFPLDSHHPSIVVACILHDRAFSESLWPPLHRCIFELLNASSHAVKYEAATTLTTLTQNPAAVKGGFFVAYGPSGRC